MGLFHLLLDVKVCVSQFLKKHGGLEEQTKQYKLQQNFGVTDGVSVDISKQARLRTLGKNRQPWEQFLLAVCVLNNIDIILTLD